MLHLLNHVKLALTWPLLFLAHKIVQRSVETKECQKISSDEKCLMRDSGVEIDLEATARFRDANCLIFLHGNKAGPLF